MTTHQAAEILWHWVNRTKRVTQADWDEAVRILRVVRDKREGRDG